MGDPSKTWLPSQSSGLSPVSATQCQRDGELLQTRSMLDLCQLNMETEFKNIKLTHIDPRLDNVAVREILRAHFHDFGSMNVQIVKDGTNRTAYVNFENPQDAMNAWKDAVTKVCHILGISSLAEPAGVVQNRFPLHEDDLRNRTNLSVPVSDSADITISDELGKRIDPRKDDTASSKPGVLTGAEEKHSVRVLFVGRLKGSISEHRLQSAFERFGPIESVVVKRHGTDGFKSFAFVRFENAKMAREAKSAMAGYEFEGVPCTVGYGKSVPSRLLWVFGFGSDVSSTWLCKTFTRFGSVDKILVVAGQEALYVLFSKEECAVEACNALKGQLVEDGQSNRRLEVDFVDQTVIEKYASIGRMLIPSENGFKQKNRRHLKSWRLRDSLSSCANTPEMDTSNSVTVGPAKSTRRFSSTLFSAGKEPVENDSHRSCKVSCKGEECCCKHGSVEPSEFDEDNFKTLFTKWDHTAGVDCDFGNGMVCSVTDQNGEQLLGAAYESFLGEHKAHQRRKITKDTSEGQRSDGTGRLERQRNNSGSSRSTMSLISNEGIDSETSHMVIRDFSDLIRHTDLCWEGKVIMKRSSCHGQLYMLSGCTRIIQSYLYNERGEAAELTVSHRFRYNVDGGNPLQWCNAIGVMYMLFIPCYPMYSELMPDELESSDVETMVKILDKREVAGVAKIQPLTQPYSGSEKLEESFLYMFTFSEFSRALINKVNASVSVFENNKEKTVLFVYVPKAS
ncbi:hypothetical protein M514_02120 [Trichuris suis]|uniref:RRM domain-containing protein n=1 Tax=Trichuris suis TaxID=68888 RepID=A0A085MI17_9BILA|nr:hypothetical protein M513_02120 [Trichuris suis]KFD61714.1 hypothetical protein M514_02120 [Trichuris suis]KHJ47376.1 hypothetical protein D918_02236 [Trichuris suis]